jgi:hypothetical protein
LNKLVLIVLSTLLSLAMIIPGATAVMADSEKEVIPKVVAKPALTMKLPDKGEVGQPVTMTVYNRYNHQPVAGAEVYALKTDKMASTTDQQNYTTSTADYAAAIDAQGIFLGVTNSDGIVSPKFTGTGRHLIVVFKASHFPAFAHIIITGTNAKALTIKSPGYAEAGKEFTLTVVERSSHEPVANAAVYGRKLNSLVVQKPKALSIVDRIVDVFKSSNKVQTTNATIIKAEPVEITEEIQNAEEVRKNGTLLGYTNNNGELVTKLDETGIYALSAVLEGYSSGFARISINLPQQKALGIKAPERAEVSKPVTITVFERRSNKVVENAAVYALRLGDLINPVAVTAEKSTTSINTPQPVVIDVSISAETVKEKGIFLGNTNNQGQISPTFDATGRYVLAAISDGYQPGLARISIVLTSQKAIAIKVPEKADVGKPVTIVTYDRNTFGPVPGAGVYALKIGEYNSPLPVEPILKSEAVSAAELEKRTADVKAKGMFLGYTNENAQLVYTFEKTGHYLLVAVKTDYLVGFARTTIVLANQKALVIKVPGEAIIGSSVPIYVLDRADGKGVAQVKLYALRLEDVDEISGAIFEADPSVADTAAKEKFTAAVTARGAYIGSTDSN